MKYIYIILIISLGSFDTNGQDIPKIKSSNNLNEIMNEVDFSFETNVLGDLPKKKHWDRWAYWWSSRLDNEGDFHNVAQKNEKALSRIERSTSLQNRSLSSPWTFKGPSQSTYANNEERCKGNGYGRVDRIAFHPSDANTFYVGGTTGGLWKTVDGGATWSCLTDHLLNISVAGIVISHSDPDVIYVLSGIADNGLSDFISNSGFAPTPDKIYKSIDGGINWTTSFDFPNDVNRTYRLKQHKTNPDIIIAATNFGLYRTINGGQTWILQVSGRFTDIEFHPTNTNIVYASGFGLYRYSTNNGDTWNQATGITFCFNSAGNPFRTELAVSPDDSNDVWLLAGPGTNNSSNNSNSYCGLFHSGNNGVSFGLRNNTPDILGRITNCDINGVNCRYSDQSNYDLAIAVNPSDQSKVITGALTLWTNSNEGFANGNWTNTVGYWEATGAQAGTLPTNYLHPDIHDIAYNPLDNKAYACSDGGVYVSSNDGASWTNISRGINVAQIFNMAVAPTNPNRIAIGLQDNGVKVRVSSASQDFNHVHQADGFDVDFSPNNSGTLVLSLNGSQHVHSGSGYASRNWLEGVGDTSFKPVRFKKDDPNIVFIGLDTMRIHNVSAGTNVFSTPQASASWEIATCADVPNRVYTAGGFNGYRFDPNGMFSTSFNGGSTFTIRTGTPNFPTTMTKITDIATYPGNCHRVAFTMGGFDAGNKVYYSTNSGASWTNISYDLPNVPVNSVEIQSNGSIYAGTDIGVFVKLINETEWLPYFNDLPRVPVTDLEISGSKILAATFGRGVWETDVYSTSCIISQLLAGPVFGNKVYEVSSTIIGESEVQGGIGTDIHFHAGDRIQLKPGFKTSTESTFEARIVPCGTPRQ